MPEIKKVETIETEGRKGIDVLKDILLMNVISNQADLERFLLESEVFMSVKSIDAWRKDIRDARLNALNKYYRK